MTLVFVDFAGDHFGVANRQVVADIELAVEPRREQIGDGHPGDVRFDRQAAERHQILQFDVAREGKLAEERLIGGEQLGVRGKQLVEAVDAVGWGQGITIVAGL